MRRDPERRGIRLALVAVAAVVWLAAADRLHWYVHPRYVGFTVVMCSLAGIAAVAAAAVLAGRPRATRLRRLGGALLIAVFAAGILVVPPATLSAELAGRRQADPGASAAFAAPDGSGAATGTAAVAEGSVRDWAQLLRQNGGAGVEGRTAELVGFVTAGESADLFSLTRFVVSCCAVDAQPVDVPVHLPGWREALSEGEWVRVDGVFAQNPDAASAIPTVLRAATVQATTRPEDPYEY